MYRVRFPGKPPNIYADVAELADALDLGSSAIGVGVRLPSSAPYIFKFKKISGSGSMVERHLAKVNVAGSSPVFRSIICGCSSMVEPLPSKQVT